MGLASTEGWCGQGALPPEPDLPVALYPEIVACANELGPWIRVARTKTDGAS